jgi:hypothetical protein
MRRALCLVPRRQLSAAVPLGGGDLVSAHCLSQQQRELKEHVHRWAQAELAPIADRVDKTNGMGAGRWCVLLLNARATSFPQRDMAKARGSWFGSRLLTAPLFQPHVQVCWASLLHPSMEALGWATWTTRTSWRR